MEETMAIVVKYEVTGMNSENYDAIMRDLSAAGLGHPDGRSYHVTFGDKTKLQVIDIFESPAKLEAFGAKLMPILEKYGVSARPDVLGEAHNAVVGA
jgi:hypothetical protein